MKLSQSDITKHLKESDKMHVRANWSKEELDNIEACLKAGIKVQYIMSHMRGYFPGRTAEAIKNCLGRIRRPVHER